MLEIVSWVTTSGSSPFWADHPLTRSSAYPDNVDQTKDTTYGVACCLETAGAPLRTSTDPIAFIICDHAFRSEACSESWRLAACGVHKTANRPTSFHNDTTSGTMAAITSLSVC